MKRAPFIVLQSPELIVEQHLMSCVLGTEKHECLRGSSWRPTAGPTQPTASSQPGLHTFRRNVTISPLIKGIDCDIPPGQSHTRERRRRLKAGCDSHTETKAAADVFVFESQINIDREPSGHEIKVLQWQITTTNGSRDDDCHLGSKLTQSVW